MKKRLRVVVTGTGSCGVGEGIAKCLRMTNTYEIYAANSDFCALPLYWNENGIILPYAKEQDYVPKIMSFCSSVSADFLIPGSESELSVLCHYKNDVERIGCILLANPPEVVGIGEDKITTNHILEKNGIGTPKTIPGIDSDNADSLGWPLIVKPRKGHGSKNVFIVQSQEHLEIIARYFSFFNMEPIMQEYIGDPSVEYTASALFDLKGSLIGSIATRRTMMGGATQMIELREYPEVCQAAESTARAMGARGPINIQCRIHKGRVVIFEINPRFSGSAPFRALAGFNEPDLLIRSIKEGRPVTDYKIAYGKIGIRGFTEILIEEDRIERLHNPLI
jgi:carbamoyl-phosphate synthase large subunit